MKKKDGFPVLYPNAAGIDIASREHYVAVNPTADEHPIKCFGTFTEDLYAIANWLIECNVDTVAMEATGIYWVSLYLILEEVGLDVVVVNAKHVKNVSGKKSDVKDAEWIRQLHSCGLLNASFQPDHITRKLRAYMRHRKNLTEMAATHIRMMQKAMEQMNIKLQNVIADITGKSGQAIIKSILNGEHNPNVLVKLLDGRIKADRDEVCKSLAGIWKEEHLFELRQSFELYHFYQIKVAECDQFIKKHLVSTLSHPLEEVTKIKKSRSNKNNLHFDATRILKEITGTDLTGIFGITDTNALEIISEIGLNMDKWPTSKHFTAWLNLAPNNRISGGKVLSTRIRKKKNKAGQIFKMAAFSVQRSKNWLAVFYHRLRAKLGVPKAITATARKIATIFYKLVKEKIPFNPIPVEDYNQTFKEKQMKKLQKQAQQFGLTLIPAN
jgi:transposase